MNGPTKEYIQTEPRPLPDLHEEVTAISGLNDMNLDALHLLAGIDSSPESDGITQTQVTERIKEQTSEVGPLTEENMRQRQAALKDKPLLEAPALKSEVGKLSEKEVFEWVDVSKIVGRSNDFPGGWSYEYTSKAGRAIDVAKSLHSGDTDKIERIFHTNSPDDRIKLTRIDGPAGPFYFVDDGSHRVIGSEVAGMSEIPCDVSSLGYPKKDMTADPFLAKRWQRLIDFNLIEGQIEEQTDAKGETFYTINVASEVLPWIRSDESDLNKISEVYEELYPGSLDNLAIPRDALVDPVANKYFMQGRWDEWVKNEEI